MPAAKIRGGQAQSTLCRFGRPWPQGLLAGGGELCLGSQRVWTAIQATAMHGRSVIYHRSWVIHCRTVIDHRLAGT